MIALKNLQIGANFTLQKKVQHEDTNLSFGRSGIETLLSTTALAGMMTEATVDLVDNNLPEGYITVAKKLEICHEKPTLRGMTVTVKVILEEIHRNILYFSAICYDEIGEIAQGKMERHIVTKNVLIDRAHKRLEQLGNISS